MGGKGKGTVISTSGGQGKVMRIVARGDDFPEAATLGVFENYQGDGAVIGATYDFTYSTDDEGNGVYALSGGATYAEGTVQGDGKTIEITNWGPYQSHDVKKRDIKSGNASDINIGDRISYTGSPLSPDKGKTVSCQLALHVDGSVACADYVGVTVSNEGTGL